MIWKGPPKVTMLITCGKEGADAIAAALQAAPFTTKRLIAHELTNPQWNAHAMHIADVSGGAGIPGWERRVELVEHEASACSACIIIYREDRRHIVAEAIAAAKNKAWMRGLIIIELPPLGEFDQPTQGEEDDAS